MWLDGKCYRVNTEVDYTTTSGYTGEEEEETMDIEDNTSEDMENFFHHQIDEMQGGRYKVTMQVAAAFFPQIIGKGGQTKSRLESDTRTKIIIPRKGMEGDITISGGDRRSVMTAANRIDVMVAAARNKHPFTHFISIPVNMEHVRECFLQFKNEVLQSCQNVRGVDETIFQTETLLHLTVGTMALLDQRERDMAREILMDCKEHVVLPAVGENGLEFEVSGLEYMNDDPGEVDVLYAGVKDRSGNLQRVVEGIVDKFVESGLMRREYDRVKLHLTLMNTLFRKEQEDLGNTVNDKGQERESFDCRPVLEGWSNLKLGEVKVEEIHLSQRRAGRRTAEGYYLPSSVVRITSCA